MKKIAFVCQIVFCVLVLSGCKSSDYKEATQLMQDGDYEKAANIYRTLEDYKDAEERAIMLEVKMLVERYQDFYDEMNSLSITNYDTELAPLVKIIEDMELLDMGKISEYPELNKYVDDIKTINTGILGVIDIDHEAIGKFFGPNFFMFPSTMALSIQNSETLYRSWLKQLLDFDFPYDYLFE